MTYLCMVFNEEKVLDAMPRAEFQALVDAHLAYDDVLRESGRSQSAGSSNAACVN